jgi:hypothetical protein
MFENGSYEESKARKSEISTKWVKAEDSDTTFLCPTNKLSGLRGRTEEELRSICVDESNNPQND